MERLVLSVKEYSLMASTQTRRSFRSSLLAESDKEIKDISRCFVEYGLWRMDWELQVTPTIRCFLSTSSATFGYQHGRG